MSFLSPKHLKLVAVGTGLLWLLSLAVTPSYSVGLGQTSSGGGGGGSKDRYCGMRLISKLSLLCDHCYKLPPKGVGKRVNGQSFLELLTQPKTESNEFPLDSNWDSAKDRSKRQESYIYGRRSSGIANKCCIESCTHAELKSYCCQKPT